MQNSNYRGRRAAAIENDDLRVTVLREGGHIAEVYHKKAGVNPLWTPPWPSIEPSAFDPSKHGAMFGTGTDAKLIAGIMGHNVCLDLFGGPSDREAAAGLTAHGEGSVVPYELSGDAKTLVARATLPIARLDVERRIVLEGENVNVLEVVRNIGNTERSIGWTQHVTLGPPFLEPGATQFRASASRSKVYETQFGISDYMSPGAECAWPTVPCVNGGTADLRTFNGASSSSGYTAHLMDVTRDTAFFVAFSPSLRLAFGYAWKRADFPWMGIWEENRSRTHSPWNGVTIARGMEFGVSPFPESREAMVARREMFGVPTYRTIPARGELRAEYRIVASLIDTIPESFLSQHRDTEAQR
jgi:hypothetical protein